MFQRNKIQPGSGYLNDESKMTGKGMNVMSPYDVSELQEVLRVYNSKGNPVTVSGMRTGLCGGAVPQGNDVLSTENMHGIVGIGMDDRGFYLRVMPCTTLNEIDRFLRIGDFSKLEELTEGAIADAKAVEKGLMYPVDPTELDGSIGGNVATNASGPRTYSMGATREWIRGMRVALADGSVFAMHRGLYVADGRRMSFPSGRNYFSFDLPEMDNRMDVKNAVGPMIHPDMDLMDLFIGSEGIFGVIVEVDVYLKERTPAVSLIAFFPDDASALSAVKDIRGSKGLDPEFIEYMDVKSVDLVRKAMVDDPSFIRIPAIPEESCSALFLDIPLESVEERCAVLESILMKNGSSMDRTWCGVDYSDKSRLRSMRHAVPRSVFEYVASLKGSMPSIHKMGTDMSVPDESADEMMDYYHEKLNEAGLEYCLFGHIGNNHPHVEIILHSMEDFDKAKEVYRDLAAKAIELGGSPSAEHGIGKIKREYVEMMYGPEGVEAIRKLKSVLDPKWILCPGNLVERVK